MEMSDKSRKCFAENVIFDIARDFYDLSERPSNLENLKEGLHLMEELKNFIAVSYFEDFTTDVKEAELAGRYFTKKEAYEICTAILERLSHICTIAEKMHWPFATWYVMAEILKMFMVQPNNKFTSFINFFLALNIDIKNDSDDSDEIIFIKKLRIIHLLGMPDIRDSSKTWQTEHNLF